MTAARRALPGAAGMTARSCSLECMVRRSFGPGKGVEQMVKKAVIQSRVWNNDPHKMAK
jgi:hypothetical protein